MARLHFALTDSFAVNLAEVASSSAAWFRLFLAAVKPNDRTLGGDAIQFPTQLSRVVNLIFAPFIPLIERDQNDALTTFLSTTDKSSWVTNAIR